MRINIKTTNVNLTPDISDYLEKKLAVFQKYTQHKDDEEVKVDVEIGKTTEHHQSGDVYKAEINIHIGGKAFRALQETEDIFSAIDQAKDQMENELRSHKEKKIHLARKGGQKIKNIIKNIYWWKK